MSDLGRDVNAFAARMRDRNVHVHRAYPKYDTHLRVSMGKIEPRETLLKNFAAHRQSIHRIDN